MRVFDIVLHFDQYLNDSVAALGIWAYLVLFLIIFCETGVVVCPFLPGDSLLFAVGALCATEDAALSLPLCLVLLFIAAVTGDAVNYSIGRAAGTRVMRLANVDPRWRRWVNPQHIARAHEFFERHGGKAIVLGRFMPIVRTFVPFVAGAAEMSYPAFAFFNVTGAVAWVGICVGGGYLFGNVPVVRENFTLVALGIVAVSLLPMVVEYFRHRTARAD